MDLEPGLKAHLEKRSGIITQVIELPNEKGDCHVKIALLNGLTDDVQMISEIKKTEEVEDLEEFLNYPSWRVKAFAYERYHFQLNIPRILDYIHGMFDNLADMYGNKHQGEEEDLVEVEGFVTGIEVREGKVLVEFVPKKSNPPQNWSPDSENIYPEFMRLEDVSQIDRCEINEALIDTCEEIRSLATLVMNGEQPRVLMLNWDSLL